MEGFFAGAGGTATSPPGSTPVAMAPDATGIQVQLHAPSEAALAWICERVATACAHPLAWETRAGASG